MMGTAYPTSTISCSIAAGRSPIGLNGAIISNSVSMRLITTSYIEQKTKLPKIGRHIIAQFDEEGVVVYQAYRPAIGNFAATYGYLGGDFSLTRMSWIKPNFLWMMYRSGWGQKEGQEVILAVKIKREALDTILANAVRSKHNPDLYPTEKDWKHAVKRSDVRLQWDQIGRAHV